MVASGSRTMIAGSLSSCIASLHQSCRFSQRYGPRRSCVGTGPPFAATGVGSRAQWEGDRRSKRSCACCRTSVALAEWLCRTADRLDPARAFGPRHRLGREAFASGPEILRRLLQVRPNTSILEQGCAGFSPGSADRNHQFTRDTWWTSPSLRPGLGFWYTQRQDRAG
jgi:hypothetical protein